MAFLVLRVAIRAILQASTRITNTIIRFTVKSTIRPKATIRANLSVRATYSEVVGSRVVQGFFVAFDC